MSHDEKRTIDRVQFFVYDWMVHESETKHGQDDEEQEESDEENMDNPWKQYENDESGMIVRAYCLPRFPSSWNVSQEIHTCRLDIHGYRPYMYVSLPDDVTKECLGRHAGSIKKQILTLLKYHDPLGCQRKTSKTGCPWCWNGQIQFVQRGRLYHGMTTTRATSRESWWYIKLSFMTMRDRRRARFALDKKTIQMPSMGQPWTLYVYETEATPILQMTTERKLPTVGWIKISEDRVSTVRHPFQRRHDNKWMVKCQYSDLVCVDKDEVIQPRIMSFDIETYSSQPNRMPDSSLVTDEIFQIGVSVQTSTTCAEKVVLTTCPETCRERLTEKWSHECHEDVRLILCENEEELLLEFHRLWRATSPHVVIGYNIFGFDFPYILRRCEMYDIRDEFLVLGPFFEKASVKIVNWSSSAYRNQHFEFPYTEGVVCVDLLPMIRRDFKLSNYKLKTVSSFFLGDTKDPLTPQDLFRAFLELQTRDNVDPMVDVIRYCIQDADLVLRLFSNLSMWVGLCEMARISHVSIWNLYTSGQQIKVFSQIYRLCSAELKYVVDPPSEPDVLPYTGAMVFPPVPGMYSWVIPFDFSSLYPTTIIAYNIDYSTFIPEIFWDVFDPSEYHAIEWEEHTCCEHDHEKYTPLTRPTYIFCGRRRFRFLKTPKGVLPQLLEHLLKARKDTRKKMTLLSDSPTDAMIRQVLDKRQLAYKVSANSMYGAMGVTKGYLPFMPGAMCTTAMGRHSIQRAASYVQEKFGAQLIYGDTDSIYVHFPHIDTAAALWEHALRVENDLLSLFPPPMKLAFEEKLYKQFLILTKKRYMALTCDQHENIDKKLTIRGVLLARRDNCSWARVVYERVVRALMSSFSLEQMRELLSGCVLDLFYRRVPLDDFVVTKLVGSDYVIQPPPQDPKKLKKRLLEMGFEDDVSQLPSQGGVCQCLTCVSSPSHTTREHHTKSVSQDLMNVCRRISVLFRRIFPSDTPFSFGYKNTTRVTSVEHRQKISKSPLSEWVAYIKTHFLNTSWNGTDLSDLFPEHTTQSVLDHIRSFVLPTQDEKYDNDDKTTFQHRGWNILMVELLREYIRQELSMDTSEDIKISLMTPFRTCLKYVEKEEWNHNQLHSKHCPTCECLLCLYWSRSLPAHVQLCQKMRQRGTIVDAGTRLEYVVVRCPNKKARLSEKLEDPVYMKNVQSSTRMNILDLDYFYYLHLLETPVDQLMEVCFHQKVFHEQVCVHLHKKTCLDELRSLFTPACVVHDAVLPYNEILRFNLPVS